ncbi:ptrB [Acrasis kona]|uniref:Prolyl endopeptidase n=1 Tax=Acrasis kona TaxID=1008807 RepID=A0AAW2Z4Y7_9EUKA
MSITSKIPLRMASQKPKAQRIPKKIVIHGDETIDHYHHLRKLNKNTKKYLKQEAEYTKQMTKHTTDLQETLFKEMKSRIKEEDISVPNQYLDYLYYIRTEVDEQYGIHCRKLASDPNAPEEVLLDLNALAKQLDSDYIYLESIKVSPNQKLLAYTIDLEGDEINTLYFKDLTTGETLHDETVREVGDSLEWANDSKTVYYTILDNSERPYKVMRHMIGHSNEQYQNEHDEEQDQDEWEDESQDEDEQDDDQPDLPNNHGMTIYKDADQKFHVSISKSLSDKYIFIESDSSVTSEMYFIDADEPNDPQKTPNLNLILQRRENVEYGVVHWKDYFYIRENSKDAINFRLIRIPIGSISKFNSGDDRHVQIVLEHNSELYIDYMCAFENYLTVFTRQDGLSKLMIFEHGRFDVEPHFVSFPDETYEMNLSDNEVQNTNFVRLSYSSFNTPDVIYDYDMKNQKLIKLKELCVVGGYDPLLYETKRIFVKSRDLHTNISVSMVYKKEINLSLQDPHPLLLYGYGAYGSCTDPVFNSNLFSLLDRGVIFCIAHVRGGGENGKAFYNYGKLKYKKNSFFDFIDCAEHLIKEKITSSDLLCISGASAGGLLVGACVNMRPELFKAAMLKVPFVDVLYTMIDPNLPLVVTEYDEWMNPLQDEESYHYISSYSPYNNIDNVFNVNKPYPALLVTGGLNDPRVSFAEPTRYVAKMRWFYEDVKKGKNTNTILFQMNMNEGHGGKSGRFDRLRDTAFNYAFVIDQIVPNK